jgi:exopolysaccharide production protein ExoZ
MGRIQSLQVLRFLAALGVVWFHANMNFGGPPNHGAAGVDVFFVISGAVIGRAARDRPASFVSDRLTRVFPIYWLLSAPWILMAVTDGRLDVLRLISSLTLLPFSDQKPYLDPAWTLIFELVFYVGTALVLRGLRLWIVALAFVAFAVANVAFGGPVLRTLGSPLIAEFVFGLFAAQVAPARAGLGWVGMALGLGIILATPVGLGNPSDTFKTPVQLIRSILWGLPSLLIVSGAIAARCDDRLWRPLAFLGDASYSLYLSHYLVMFAFIEIVGRGASPLMVTALCVCVSVPIHLWMERPLLAWSRMIAGRSNLAAA